MSDNLIEDIKKIKEKILEDAKKEKEREILISYFLRQEAKNLKEILEEKISSIKQHFDVLKNIKIEIEDEIKKEFSILDPKFSIVNYNILVSISNFEYQNLILNIHLEKNFLKDSEANFDYTIKQLKNKEIDVNIIEPRLKNHFLITVEPQVGELTYSGFMDFFNTRIKTIVKNELEKNIKDQEISTDFKM